MVPVAILNPHHFFDPFHYHHRHHIITTIIITSISSRSIREMDAIALLRSLDFRLSLDGSALTRTLQLGALEPRSSQALHPTATTTPGTVENTEDNDDDNEAAAAAPRRRLRKNFPPHSIYPFIHSCALSLVHVLM